MKKIIVLILIIGFAKVSKSQVYTPGGTVQSATGGNGTMGINIENPDAELDIYQEMRPTTYPLKNVPALRINSSRYYNPNNNPCLINRAQSNLVEIYSVFDTQCGLPAPTIPYKKKARLILNKDGRIGLNSLPNNRSLMTLGFGKYGTNGKQNDILSFSYEGDNNYHWNYANQGYDKSSFYITNNAQLRNSKWWVDEGSFLGEATGMFFDWRSVTFKSYRHPSNQQGANIHKWKMFQESWKNNLQIRNNGQVIIGEKSIASGTHTDFRLSVDGKFVAKEGVITLNGWADYVFKDDYQLKSLDEVEVYIQENKHLPNVPSEKDMIQSGLNLSEIIKTQQEKIEELTLYLIRQNKRINKLENKINSSTN